MFGGERRNPSKPCGGACSDWSTKIAECRVSGCPAFPMVSCHRIWLAANAIVTIAQSLSLRRRKRQRAVVMTPTGPRDSNPVPSQEDRLLDLLRKAEGYAYALAHGYDIGGHPNRAYGLVALGERIRDTATDVGNLARPIEPHSAAPLHGLRSRVFSLRQLLRGTAWQGPSVAPLVPRLAGEQTERVPLRKVTA